MSIRDLITVDLLKKTYIAGVNLNLPDGSPYPDEMFELAIDAAISTVEAELGIVIDPFHVKGERHDAILQHADAYYPMMLDVRPVRSVSALNIQLGNYPLIDMPADWIMISAPQAGQVSVVPIASTLGSFFFRSGVPLLMGDIFNPRSYMASYFNINYEAGFFFSEGTATIPLGENSVEVPLTGVVAGERVYFQLVVDDAAGGAGVNVRQSGSDSFTISAKTAPTTGDMQVSYIAHSVDPLILKAIGLIAAITPLDIAGDLIAGAGIAQFSVGIDGLSQSVATTSSATNSGYGARIGSFQTQLKQVMSQLRGKYRMLQTFSI